MFLSCFFVQNTLRQSRGPLFFSRSFVQNVLRQAREPLNFIANNHEENKYKEFYINIFDGTSVERVSTVSLG